MDEGSAILRGGTAAEPTGAPVRSPGPSRLASVGICPLRRGGKQADGQQGCRHYAPIR